MSVGGGAVRRPHLLLAEDDRELRGMLEELLTSAGYAVDPVGDGVSARQCALTGDHAVAVFDRGLPHLDGLEVLRGLRRAGWAVPVLILSAYATAADRVTGLDAGAEDYLVKPFDLEELLARLRALRRRHIDWAVTLPVPGGIFDPASHTVDTPDGHAVTLSRGESALLALLARRPGRVFSRDDIRVAVFDRAEAPGMADTYVYYLRRKLGRGVIRTVRGTGYSLGDMTSARPVAR